MGRKIIILTLLSFILALSEWGVAGADAATIPAAHNQPGSSYSVTHGSTFSTFALAALTYGGTGSGCLGAFKYQKTNVHAGLKRAFQSQPFFSVSRRDVTRPISDLTGTFRHLVVLEKLLI